MYKRRIALATLSLILCFLVLLSSSFAWYSLSVAPEITGIDTYVGANGSLEIALLSDETYMDPSLIRSAVGDSVVIKDAVVSNLSWGNLLDLSDSSYGLGMISMIPSRLNVYRGSDGEYVIGNNMLSVPQYGIDGRFTEFQGNTVSALYNGAAFSFTTGIQQYGVRGIGVVSGITVQQSALANARSLVRSYRSAAISAVNSVWTSNGRGLLDITYRRYGCNQLSGYTNGDVALLRDTAVRMNNALSYIDLALRQGIVGYAAMSISDETEFKSLRSSVEDTAVPLSLVAASAPDALPSGFLEMISQIETDRLNMQKIVAGCDAMTVDASYGGSYPWQTVEEMVYALLNLENTYLGNTTMNTDQAYNLMTEDNVLTITPTSGVMAHIADYCGNYNAFFQFSRAGDETQLNVEAISTSVLDKPLLEQISEMLEKGEAVSGDSASDNKDLEEVFGYALDLAFRCNTDCDLLLQTNPEIRVTEDEEFVTTQGGGSYMSFSSVQLTQDQMVMLMDALRVGFVDNQNHLIALAKLNTSNYETTEDGVKAPLLLYEFEVSADGSISVGERKSGQSAIMELPEDIATVLSVVVWLDGDHVDNSLAAINVRSMTGSLNLQFSSSANLVSSDQNFKNNQ